MVSLMHIVLPLRINLLLNKARERKKIYGTLLMKVAKEAAQTIDFNANNERGEIIQSHHRPKVIIDHRHLIASRAVSVIGQPRVSRESRVLW